ncbi:MAG: acyl-CoA desaturase, partial [Acidobacteriota bacterium]
NHGALSTKRWVNRLMAYSLDLVGGSSYFWSFKHNRMHHTYTNLSGADDDINLGPLGRLSPAQRQLWFHRFQHLYLWPLYATIGLKWQLFDDFACLVTGRVGRQKSPRPRGWDLAGLLLGKALFATAAFLIPALRHPLWLVLIVYVATMLIVGFVLSVVFQLAHSVGEADHPVIADGAHRVGSEWAVHQVETTVDFARDSRLLSWFLGGLNHQIEHHLFPRVSHVHYPAISRIVEEVSAQFGVRYAAHRSFLGAVASHYRFLREMGRLQTDAAR